MIRLVLDSVGHLTVPALPLTILWADASATTADAYHPATPVVGVVVLIALIAIYFVPTIIAGLREHQNTVAIFALNLLLGWTLVFWVMAFVWALINSRDDRQQ